MVATFPCSQGPPLPGFLGRDGSPPAHPSPPALGPGLRRLAARKCCYYLHFVLIYSIQSNLSILPYTLKKYVYIYIYIIYIVYVIYVINVINVINVIYVINGINVINVIYTIRYKRCLRYKRYKRYTRYKRYLRYKRYKRYKNIF